MRDAAADLEFEEAARLRDEIRRLEQADLGLSVEPTRRGSALAKAPTARAAARRPGAPACRPATWLRAKMRAAQGAEGAPCPPRESRAGR